MNELGPSVVVHYHFDDPLLPIWVRSFYVGLFI